MKTTNKLIPFEATHPGSLIFDEIKYRGIRQTDLAIQLDVQLSLLNEIIKGKRALTADIAILLEKILEIPAEYWMKLQSQYEIDLARIKEKNINRMANVESWNTIKNVVPVNYLKKQNYLTDDIEQNIRMIQSIYNVSSIQHLVQKSESTHFAYHRKSEKLALDDKNIFAWNMVADYEAGKQKVKTFSYSQIPSLINELKQIFLLNSDTVKSVKNKLNEYGIKFVLVPKIDKAPIDGYTFWSIENPAIAMTGRHQRIDNFAFTILHEIAHIDLHLKVNNKKQFFDFSEEGNSMDKFELEADEYAKSNLISPDEWKSITSLPEFNDYSINLKAKEFSINPAIILGRLSYEKKNFALKTSIDKTLK